MNLHILSLGTLVPETPWCMFYATKHRAHSRAVDCHTHINIYLHHLLCCHSSCLYNIEWIIQWYQKFTFHNVFFFKNCSLVKVIHMLIRWYKTRFFLWNTNNTDRNGVIKENTHTHTHTPNTLNTLRERTLERVS